MNFVLVAVLLLAGFITVIALQPPTFTIERSILVSAPPEAIFPLLTDFHRWAQWSPWDQLDSNMKRTYGGPDSGVGATYAWQSPNNRVGEGRMAVTAAVPHSSVEVRLEFIKPFPGVNQVHLVLAPGEGGTRLTWTMVGTKTFVSKAFHLVMNMDKLIGPDFEKGLASIQTLAQASPQGASAR
jgi:hypothetical protein